MNENDISQEISLIFGPVLLFLYLWMAISIFRAAKLAEDKTAIKRFKYIFLLNGVILVVPIISTIYEAVKLIPLLLCIGMPIIFISTFISFRRFVPWFWRNRSIFPPYNIYKK